MKLNFLGDLGVLGAGLEILQSDLGFQISADGLPVTVETSDGRLEAGLAQGRGFVRAARPIHFFRALGLFIEAARRGGDFHIIEQPQFTTDGVMVDMSRNGVMRVESIKTLLRKMAVMGLTTLMLYTEDTYELPDEPFFGYLRGRYSDAEIKECDDYAFALGIEMIPCIQTLGHLEQFIKWVYYSHGLHDTKEVLLVDSPATYEFIEKMIRAASAPYRSKRIHIGMDEAHGLGRGRYLDKFGQADLFEVMNRHLRRVLEIAGRYGLQPMIWSDMYFRIGSATHDYYDLNAVMPEHARAAYPSDVALVYWDYYNDDPDLYRGLIRRHLDLSPNVIFAGGLWTWMGFGINYGKVFKTSNTALDVCKELGLREVIATIWSDDGAENDHFAALLGLQLFAEHGYSRELDLEKLKSRFEFCAGASFEAFLDLKYLDEVPGTVPDNNELYSPANPAKYLLWQDPLLGLFDRHAALLDLTAHYTRLAETYRRHLGAYPEYSFLFEPAALLCEVLQRKWDLGVRLKASYDSRDLPALARIATVEIPDLIGRVEALRQAHRGRWLKTYKPFGWEVLDYRYGGVVARLSSAGQRVEDFLAGRIDRIEELEEARLFFDGRPRPQEGLGPGACFGHYRIMTAGVYSHVWPLM